jgi:hypothetical protein
VSHPSFEQSALRQITRADGVSKEIRVHDGHLFRLPGLLLWAHGERLSSFAVR